ncbi:MAG TPA: nickel pincer cofactor biosynthesis protein LarC [Intrasporangium sp.]|uniref:nickel pincer cofactor biosynthesis protein LarC n=1 Tax=Intrasporangium sp. TaxID=1925024 RepID=UPI002F922B37
MPSSATDVSQPATPQDRIAWIDASAGVAGDMLLGALVDAGASLDIVRAAVEAVIPGTVRITAADTTRAGMRALKVGVELTGPDQPHRPWAEIRRLLASADLADTVGRRAFSAFEALARVEARVHGVEVDEVRFHEVGAWDSIADVVGVCAALDDLGVSEVVVSAIAVGSGSVRGSHGLVPVPVPAVLGLTVGWVVEAVGEGELATPTGVALLTTSATRQGPLPSMEVAAVGVGAGTRDVDGRANVVRVVVGSREPQWDEHPTTDVAAGSSASGDEGLDKSLMVVLEANVDDLDPRVWPSVLTALLDHGAADAWLTPIVMKKGRPAHTLSVLTQPGGAARLRDLVLARTSTIGVRQSRVSRWALPRSWVDVDVDGQRVAVKVAHRNGQIITATPEFSAVEAAAAALDRPVRDVLATAVAAAVDAGLVPGGDAPSGDA